MTLVLVHGNPRLRSSVGPTGGCTRTRRRGAIVPTGIRQPTLPDDFAATSPRLTATGSRANSSAVDGPIDLVGHDWGGCHVMNVVMHRPELVRSWASDVLGLFDPDYVWHDLAQVWQTAGDGEQLVDTHDGRNRWRPRRTDGHARHTAATSPPRSPHAQGPEMGRAILSLYRSAAQPVLAEAGRSLPEAAAAPPGVVVVGHRRPLHGLR